MLDSILAPEQVDELDYRHKTQTKRPRTPNSNFSPTKNEAQKTPVFLMQKTTPQNFTKRI